MSAFLTDIDLITLTGRKAKGKQIEWLRNEGIAFRINATGRPVVLWTAIDPNHTTQAPAAQTGWTLKVLEQRI